MSSYSSSSIYVSLVFEDYGEIVASFDPKIDTVQRLVKSLPFESEVIRWKEEVYFSTPVKVEQASPSTTRVNIGDVAFWPPGNALCLFYGISQPYSEVIPLGFILGPPHLLGEVEEGTKVKVIRHTEEIIAKYKPILDILRDMGFEAAVREWEGEVNVVATGTVVHEGHVYRVPLEISAEDYNIFIEASPIVKYSETVIATGFLKQLKSLLAAFDEIRIDVDEEGYMCLSSAIHFERLRLEKALDQMKKAYVSSLALLGIA